MSAVTSTKRRAGRPPLVWGDVPQRNPNFTGRAELRERLHCGLRQSWQTAVLSQALDQIGGVGKSQIAIEYVHRYSDEYDPIWLISMERLREVSEGAVQLPQVCSFFAPEPVRKPPTAREQQSTALPSANRSEPLPAGNATRKALRDSVTIGVIAALPVEAAAFSAQMYKLGKLEILDDPNTYRIGELPSNDPARPHRVALVTLLEDNTRNAAATCTDLLRTFPNIECVLTVGVAGGVPAPDRPERHVRLGDVVVAKDGIVDFGHVRRVEGDEVARRPVGGVSVPLHRAANELLQREIESGSPQWNDSTETPTGQSLAAFVRPPAETDRLVIGGRIGEHPSIELSGHRPGRPKVHYGLIGSGDVLLRDAKRRDELAGLHGILAVEMECAGVAVSARQRGIQWFMVRGIVDYCENVGKNDRWHGYSALMAARYAAALLKQCRPFGVKRRLGRHWVYNVLETYRRIAK